MKIIGIKNSEGAEASRQVFQIPDSGIIFTNRPFFVPRFAKRFTARAALALHMGRLGKHIAPRFAHRYVSALSPAITVTASGLEHRQACEEHSALARCFDGALLLGDSVTLEAGPENGINDATVSAAIDGSTATAQQSLAMQGIDYRELIAWLSTMTTMKMGDIIVVEMPGTLGDMEPGQTLHASLGSEPRLTIRVK